MVLVVLREKRVVEKTDPCTIHAGRNYGSDREWEIGICG